MDLYICFFQLHNHTSITNFMPRGGGGVFSLQNYRSAQLIPKSWTVTRDRIFADCGIILPLTSNMPILLCLLKCLLKTFLFKKAYDI